MSLQDRIEALKAKHKTLEDAIDQEHRKPIPDDILVASLKRQKLRLKDEMARLTQH